MATSAVRSAPPTASEAPVVEDLASTGNIPLNTQVVTAVNDVQQTVNDIKRDPCIDPIYQTTWFQMDRFSWRRGLLAGNIIYKKTLHPDDWFTNLRVLSNMYHAFAGGLRLKIEIAGTGFHAGKLALVKTPPGVDLRNSGPNGYSYYPYVLLDPKVTGGIEVCGEDQKNVSFHWSSDTSDSNFGKLAANGGTLWLIIVAPLETSSTGSDSINLVTFGSVGEDFAFYQLREYSVQTTPISVVHAPMIVPFHSDPIDLLPLVGYTLTLKNRLIYGQTHISFAGTSTNLPVDAIMTPSTIIGPDIVYDTQSSVPTSLTWKKIGLYSSTLSIENAFTTKVSLTSLSDINTGHSTSIPGTYLPHTPLGAPVNSQNARETIVLFGDGTSGLGVTQSQQWRYLLTSKVFASITETIVFTLRSRLTGQSIAYIRLWPNGVFTTPTPTAITFASFENYKLVFDQFLPAFEDIPISGVDMSTAMTLHTIEQMQKRLIDALAFVPTEH